MYPDCTHAVDDTCPGCNVIKITEARYQHLLEMSTSANRRLEEQRAEHARQVKLLRWDLEVATFQIHWMGAARLGYVPQFAGMEMDQQLANYHDAR